MQAKQKQALSLTMRGLGRKRKRRCRVDGHGGRGGQQVWGFGASEFDCGSVGDANLPETLDNGLDVVVIIGNKGEYGKSVFSTFDNRNGHTS